ncbi:MAG: hypothetical protein OEY59_03675, partial [Deltaproteobacteria bacterium]|nr:hypothetical protein [Deltaproteobacteria bacterium]
MRLDHKKPLTPIIKGLLIISILALSSLLTQSKVKAQDFGGGFDTGFAAPGTSKKSVGLGISMSTKHQEEGIEPAGINNEIYFNWNSFRVGYNILQAGYNFTKYEKKYQATIDTQAVYTAYVFSTREQNSPFDFYVLGGMSYLMSILT